MNIVCQLFYHIYSYVSIFLIIILAKTQAINNRLLTLCQYGGSQYHLPLWNRALQWILIIIGALCARLIAFLTPKSVILRTKNPTVVTNDLKRLHSKSRHADRSAILQHVSEPIFIPQLRKNTDDFQHHVVNTCQLNNEILNHPSFNYVAQPPKPEAILMSDTDHFEHVDVEKTEPLLEEIKSANKEDLHHTSEPAVMVPSTDIELLDAALEAHKV